MAEERLNGADLRRKTLRIRTPEGIEFSMQLAGPISRFLAWSLDIACISAALGTVSGLFQVVTAMSRDIGSALHILAGFVLSIGYGIWCEWYWRGQTVGKRLLKLRVMDERGLRVRFSQIVVRNLLRAADILPGLYLLGGLISLLHGRGQRLGDIAAGTVVIRIGEAYKPSIDRLEGDKFNSLREYPHLAMRLRSLVSPEEAFLAFRALIRRDELEPEARVVLFRELAEHFQQLVKFPQEALDGLTDERYVRNVIDLVFSR